MKKLLTTLAVGLAVAAGVQAQTWPDKPVTLLVPFPPGGSTDLIARTLSPKLQEKFGGIFVVENKAGAGGTIGAAAAKRAAPDGYTIFVSSLGPFVIGPHLIKNPGYDPLKDFDYITVAVQAPNVLAVPANSPHKIAGRRHRLPEGEPRQDDLRLGGQRHERSPHGRAVLAGDGHHRRAHPLQGRCAGDVRPARRSGRCDLHEHQHRPQQHQGRQAAGAGHHQHQALAAAARRADDGRVRRQGRHRLLVAGRWPHRRDCRRTSRPSCMRPSSRA